MEFIFGEPVNNDFISHLIDWGAWTWEEVKNRGMMNSFGTGFQTGTREEIYSFTNAEGVIAVGYVRLQPVRRLRLEETPTANCEIAFAVHPNLRRRGAGLIILRTLTDNAKDFAQQRVVGVQEQDVGVYCNCTFDQYYKARHTLETAGFLFAGCVNGRYVNCLKPRDINSHAKYERFKEQVTAALVNSF